VKYRVDNIFENAAVVEQWSPTGLVVVEFEVVHEM
jgi:hypothetical protein